MRSSLPPTAPTRFIWVTRGRTWGFRFLRSGGFDDPLHEYELAFAGLENEPEVFCRVNRDVVALRFPDPEGRQDSAGRIIPHDFVLLGDWAEDIQSVTQGRDRVWPAVAAEYTTAWDAAAPTPTGM